jgi:hypothetical protein
MAEKEPTQRTDKGPEIPVPTRQDSDDPPSKVIRPGREMEEAAAQEAEYPEDETNEG